MRSLFRTKAVVCIFGLIAAVSGHWTAAHASTVLSIDYVFPDPNTGDGSPDPAVWTRSGTLTPFPDPVNGLGIADVKGFGMDDLDFVGSLLYSHVSPELLVAGNGASFRALGLAFALPDASPGWQGNLLSWRMILDDGTRRLELALARDPATFQRQLRVVNAPGVAPILFPWNNDRQNSYEIDLLPSGDFVVVATNNDPATPVPVVTLSVPASALPPSGGSPLFAWGMAAAGGGVSFWQEVHGQVTRTVTDIGLDTKELEIELGANPEKNEIEWRGALTLPAGTTIDPVVEEVSIELVSGSGLVFQTTLGMGSFVAHPDGGFRFKSSEDAAPELKVRFKPRSGTLWEFKLEVEDLPLTVADRTQVTGTLVIGDKVGTQTLPLADKGKRLVFKAP